jgi:hypothetical protein
MFAPGEIVVCVNKKPNYASNDGRNIGLTIGKKYEIKFIKHKLSNEIVYIINDYNTLDKYYDYRFITLDKYRRQKLSKICSNLTT